MNRQLFIDILEVIKPLKDSDHILIENNIVYAAYGYNNYFKKMKIALSIPYIIACETSLLFKYIKDIDTLDDISKLNNTLISTSGYKLCIYRNDIRANILFFISKIDNMLLNQKIYQISDLKQHNDFANSLDNKTADGITRIRIEDINKRRFCLMVFKGLLNLTKSDSVSLDIYDIIFNYSVLAHYVVHKKKNVIIDVYAPSLYIN